MQLGLGFAGLEVEKNMKKKILLHHNCHNYTIHKNATSNTLAEHPFWHVKSNISNVIWLPNSNNITKTKRSPQLIFLLGGKATNKQINMISMLLAFWFYFRDAFLWFRLIFICFQWYFIMSIFNQRKIAGWALQPYLTILTFFHYLIYMQWNLIPKY